MHITSGLACHHRFWSIGGICVSTGTLGISESLSALDERAGTVIAILAHWWTWGVDRHFSEIFDLGVVL